MGLFSVFKKKKKEAKQPESIPEAPELTFPEIPSLESGLEHPSEAPSVSQPPGKLPEISEELPEMPELPEIPEAPGVIPDIEEFIPEKKPGELPDIKVPAVKGKQPLFINLDEYRELMEHLNKAKSALTEYTGVSSKLSELKTSKDNSYEKFRNTLEAIERKLLYIDKVIFEGG